MCSWESWAGVGQRSTSPRMKASSWARPWSSAIWTGGGLHEVGGGGQDGAADAAVEGDLGGADGVDDDAGGVGGVPDLELVFDVERDVAERAALQADVGPLAVGQPRHVVRRSDVHVDRAHVAVDLGGD